MSYKSRIMWGLCIVLTFFCSNVKGQNANNLGTLSSLAENVIPQVSQVEDITADAFTLDTKVYIFSTDVFLSNYLNDHLKNLLGKRLTNARIKGDMRAIVLNLKRGTPKSFAEKEQYELSVNSQYISITGYYQGVFNGINTLLQLLPPQVYNADNKQFIESYKIPAGKISDIPQYAYRGFMLDVSRTFVPIKKVYDIVDFMAYHKINKFHWHLSDDQGWRPEIKSFPRLTEIGAFRGENLPLKNVLQSGSAPYGGFYTQQEMRELVEYASQRNIEIIPEIDIPGHSMSEAVAYPDIICSPFRDSTNSQTEYSREIWCVANEHNYAMLDSIIRELSSVFTTTEYFNIGGDEVNHFNWKKCPECQALMKREGLKDEYELHNYFVRRCDAIAHKYGKKLMGWEELMAAGSIDPETLVVVWKNRKPIKKALTEHHPFVLQVAEFSYFDMKQSPLERGHDWAGLVPLEKAYELDPVALCNGALEDTDYGELNKIELRENSLLGVQGGLWQELGIRPDNYIEYQYFPRMCTIAEVGWSNPEKNYEKFYKKLTQHHFDRMQNMGIRFRVPPPIVTAEKISKRKYKITVTPPYEGAVVKYAITPEWAPTDSRRGQPDDNDYKYIYTKPIKTKNIAQYRFTTFTTDDKLKSFAKAVENVPLYEYIKPTFTIETNLDTTKNTLASMQDYDFKTLGRARGRIAPGGYLTIVLDKPIKCNVIEILTGRPSVDFYGIQYGHVEYSLDGVNYTRGGDFNFDRSITLPKGKFKYVKICITGGTDCRFLYLCDPLFY